jgi:predicted nucleotidyltransferase
MQDLVESRQLQVYRQTWLKRQQREQWRVDERRRQAWSVVERAASLLKGRFHASKVVLFGSLATDYDFSIHSDIDLAAWGLCNEDYWVAIAQLQDLSPSFKIDLVKMEDCPPALRATIETAGKAV